MPLPPILKTSLAYAAMVFGVGFVLGAIRVTLVVPRIGMRWAELLEMPFMLAACFLAARFVVRAFGPFGRPRRLAVGLLALAWLLLAEVCLVLAQGMTMAEYAASRDPISGSAYLLSLALFAAMPLLVGAFPRIRPH